METGHPPLTAYHKSIPSKIELLRSLASDLRKDYSIELLEALEKEAHHLASSSKPYGYLEASQLCQGLEVDLMAQIKNYNLSKASPQFFTKLDTLITNIETAFTTPQKNISMQDTHHSRKGSKRKIIVVDDDEDILKLLSYEFHEIGFETQTFQTGSDALAYILKVENLNDVFLLILDRMLPDMDGLDILEQFMQKSPVKIPVLVLSALNTEEDIIAGLQSGAVDYITKPFSVFMLMQKALNMLKTQAT